MQSNPAVITAQANNLISTHDLQVCVHTGVWSKKNQEWRMPSGWPTKDHRDKPDAGLNDLYSRREQDAVHDCTLHYALTKRADRPAWLVQYAPTPLKVRLNKTIFDSHNWTAFKELAPEGLKMVLAIFDIDAHGGQDVDAWFDEQRPKIASLQEDHPGVIVFRSKGGMRIVGALPEPIELESYEDACRWTHTYSAWCRYLARTYGFASAGKEGVDDLGEWNRYQRIPHDSRVRGERATELEVIGDVEWIGVWDPELIEVDYPKAKATRSAAHKDFSGECHLLNILQRSALRCDPTNDPNVWSICCPNFKEHSPNAHGEQDYESKTLLYSNGPVGKIECKSDTCQAKHPDKSKDYFQYFSAEEVEAARPVRLDLMSPEVEAVMKRADERWDRSDIRIAYKAACARRKAGLPPLVTPLQEELKRLRSKAPTATANDSAPQPDPEPTTTKPVVEKSHCESTYTALYSFMARGKDTPYGAADAKLAHMARHCFGEMRCRRVKGGHEWLVWSGSTWVSGEVGSARVLCQELADCIETDAKDMARALRQDSRRDAVIERWTDRMHASKMDMEDRIKAIEAEIDTMRKMATKMNSVAGRNAVLTAMGDGLLVDVSDLDNNIDEVAFENTYWRASSNTFVEPCRESMATRSVGVDWEEPSQEARAGWQEYLASLGFDDTTLSFLRRSFGCAAIGRGPTEKRFWWFRGEADTSKSTLIDIVSRSLGGYSESTMSDTWLLRMNARQGHSDEIANLRGCRLVTADEFPENSRFDASLIKTFTGGTGMKRASHKGEKGFSFRPRFAMFFASNFDPHISEDDSGSMARITTLTFSQKIQKKNRHFVDQLLAQGDMRLAVIEWIMQGAREYLAQGLGAEPMQVTESRAEFREGQVSVADQLLQLVAKKPGGALTMSQALEALNEYQKRTRQHCVITTRAVGKVLRDKFGAQSRKSNGGIVFDGLTLRDEARPVKKDTRYDYLDEEGQGAF